MTALHSMSSQIKTQPRTISPTLTGAGVIAAINVPKNGIEVAVTHIAFGTAKYKATGAEIGLQHEMMRVAIAGGGKVSPTQIQVHAEAIAPAGSPFWCGEIGFYAGDNLFAIYSKPDQPILYFADDSVTTVSYTLGLAALPADSVTVLVDPNVNTAIQLIGAHETATDPHPQYLTNSRGDTRYFRKLPAVTSSDTDCDALLETGVRDVSVANDRGVIAATRLPADADGYGTLTTENGGQFVHQVYTEATIAHRTWQRSGYLGTNKPFEGHDWKLLWDSRTFDPAAKQDKLAYIPVQQGTGVGQSQSTVKIGAAGDQLKATVDQRDLGSFVFQSSLDATLKSYLPLTGGSVSGQLQVSGSIGAIGSIGPGRPTIEVMGKDQADHAYMTFHRPGIFATHFGLDGNNDLAVGGYSMGASAYKLWHAGNFNPGAKQDALGYPPVQQGTGIGQTPNIVKIGWTNGNGVRITVDATDMGTVVLARGRVNLNWNGIGGQPTWMFGGNSPDDVNVYNPSNFSVNYANSTNYANSAGTASYATQLTGQGLVHGGIGGYHLNKNHTTSEVGGAWELRGHAYDFGSGGDGGMGTRAALWQRVA